MLQLDIDSKEFNQPQFDFNNFTPSYNENYIDFNSYKFSQPKVQNIKHKQSQSRNRHTSNTQVKTKSDYFISDALRRQLEERAMLSLLGSDPEDPLVQDLPRQVYRYYNLYPLENITKTPKSAVFGFNTFCYKATDGKNHYCLRNIQGCNADNENANRAIELWRPVKHPNIVSLVEAFFTKAFNNINTMVVVYDFHFGFITLEERFKINNTYTFINEDTLWEILIQLVSALRLIHSKNLAARTVYPSKILINYNNQVKINCVGIDDIFNYDNRKHSNQIRKMEDIINLGYLLLNLACPSQDDVYKKLQEIQNSYSNDFYRVVLRLLGFIPGQKRQSNQPSYPTLNEIQQMLTDKLFAYTEKQLKFNETLNNELYKEFENGRLVRLLIKLGFINERPENDRSIAWSETGERYLIKLFRDYVFHQVDENGVPVIDYGHVVDSLNKLDQSSKEKVLLMSRDEKSMILLTYEDINRCINEAFSELVRSQMEQQLAQPSYASNFYSPQPSMNPLYDPQSQYPLNSGNYYVQMNHQ